MNHVCFAAHVYVYGPVGVFPFVRPPVKESSWDLGTDERLASGIYPPSGGAEDPALLGELYNNTGGSSSLQEPEEPESASSSWREQARPARTYIHI